jgi:hypothetical protein
MHLLYLDESGTEGGDYFILAGLSVFEHHTYFFSNDYDHLQNDFFPSETDPIELHASQIRARSDPPWDRLTAVQSHEFLDRGYYSIAKNTCVLFGVAIDRASLKPEDGDEYSFAFESIVRRFDNYLVRLHKDGDRQKGLVIIADSSFRQRIESLAGELLRSGTRWGQLFNQVEIPLFTLARNSRLLQAADFCANAIKGRYEGGFARQFDRIALKFDADPVTHELLGLYHHTQNRGSCFCPACLSRRHL